ncbi:hypothetical protein ACSLVK_13945 [Photorhabdus tasmaniensis]|uniref:hypothetical protein n=1 Tax=Photorhabdus tasmaniensis TaxID=1004159 RepID=UPI004041C19E
MSLGDEIVARIARIGALHAAPVAAREGDPIKHASFLGALAGAITLSLNHISKSTDLASK